MDTSHSTSEPASERFALTRRGLLIAGLGGAALITSRPFSSAAITIPSLRSEAAARTLLPWTNLALELIQETRPSPPRAARALALLHVAMAEAAFAERPATHDAIAGAAATVLGELFPRAGSQIAAVLQSGARSPLWIATRSPQANHADIASGRKIGQEVLARGQADGSDAVWDGQRPTGSRTWQPTPPEYRQDPIEPLAGQWRPWVVPGGDAMRPAPPPEWGSPLWDAELLAVREAVRRRSAEQETAVRFWAGGPGTVTPAGIWIEIARDLIVRDGLGTPAAARVLALTSVAMVDAFICCWNAKYAYWLARPITADPDLDVLIPTPPFPSYTSGHATVSAAAATVLSDVFPADGPELRRKADEAKHSRLWAGIHFPLDNEMGALGGGVIGRLVIARAAETGVAWEQVRGSAPAAAETWSAVEREGLPILVTTAKATGSL